MSLLDRVSTLLRANLNDLVEKAEDPERMLKQVVLDMENQLMQVKTQVAIAIADQHLLEKKKAEHGQQAAEWHRKAELAVENPSVQPEAIAWLQSQKWSGNVRELENVTRRAMLLARPFAVSLEHVQQVLDSAPKPLSISNQTHSAYIAELLARVQRGDEEGAYTKMIADLEPELFSQAIQLAQGNQARAARWLGITRLKMREKLVQFGLHTVRDASEQ
jgi:DNA-binding protein Fis